MKKIILTITIVLGISQFAKAQTEVGAGFHLSTGTSAIEAKANFGISDVISISPSFDYFLVNSALNYTQFMISADGHYNFDVSEGFTAYPLLGLNYLSTSFSSNNSLLGTGFGDGLSSSSIGLNIGGGATYKLSDAMKLYGELKYVRSGIGLSAGVLFSL